MTTKLNTTAGLILAHLTDSKEPVSAASIAKAIKKSESVVRENLVKLVAAKSVQFNTEGKAKFFFIPAPAAKEDDLLSTKKSKKLPKSRVKGLILPTSAKGHPSAKKVVNPQPTLEIKKLAIRLAKGTMVWANRVWVITIPGRDAVTMHSRELAKMTVGELCKALHIEVPTSTTPAA